VPLVLHQQFLDRQVQLEQQVIQGQLAQREILVRLALRVRLVQQVQQVQQVQRVQQEVLELLEPLVLKDQPDLLDLRVLLEQLVRLALQGQRVQQVLT
jgi:hypothetical protein